MKLNLALAGLLLVGMLALGAGCEEPDGLIIGNTPGGTSTTTPGSSASTKPSPTASGDLGGRVTDD